MRILKKLLSLRSNRSVREAEISLHEILVKVIGAAVINGSMCDADADAEKAAKAFAKGLAAFAAERAVPISGTLPSDR